MESGHFVGLTDFLVPSYIPTLSAVLTARQGYCRISKNETKILLACVPDPFKGRPLPFARQEIQDLQEVLPMANVLNAADLNSSGATALVTKERLPEASILHLACHGYQNPEQPLDSGFVMHDEMLTVAQLMSLRLPKAFLAFLSACETAKGDANQPDQAVHLAAAMFFSGFKSIIGTMWYVQCLHYVVTLV
jgi:CHAT domain-containing protein